MTRKGPAGRADGAFGEERLKIARVYLKAAQALTIAESADDLGNPIMDLAVNAAIAFTDALTAKYAGQVNRRDHQAAAKLLRDALGDRLTEAQSKRLRRILGEKNEVQYGARTRTLDDARTMLAQLETFALWAEAEFARVR